MITELKLLWAYLYTTACQIVEDTKGMAVANRIINIAIAMFILGAIGATAFVMASNATAYSGADSTVITIMTIAVPIMGGVAIMLALLKGR